MSEFEKAAMRIMVVLFVGLMIILYLQLISCSKPVPPPPSDYIDEVDTSDLV